MTWDTCEAGPIPAHAGEPIESIAKPVLNWAYPRACGGTRDPVWNENQQQGLSPRMRGNRHHVKPSLPDLGPIPAHAGEPNLVENLIGQGKAYPRACGGTT